MPYLLLLLLLTLQQVGWAQRSRTADHPERIAHLSRQIKKEPTNDALIWERLKLEVDLLPGVPSLHTVFKQKANVKEHLQRHLARRAVYYPPNEGYQPRPMQELEADFAQIDQNVLQGQSVAFITICDFHLYSMRFYASLARFDQAIEQAQRLKSCRPEGRYQSFYISLATRDLFNLQVANNQYEDALQTAHEIIEQRKKENPIVHFANNLNHEDMVAFFQYFDQKAPIVSFLQQTCREHFEWYLGRATDERWPNWDQADYLKTVKIKTLSLLQLTTQHMKEQGHPDWAAFEEVYQTLRYTVEQPHERPYETINPNLSDAALKDLLSKIFP